MSEVTLSIMELGFLKETLELVVEEFQGIEEGIFDLENYVMTTGALEDCKNALNLIDTLAGRLEEDSID